MGSISDKSLYDLAGGFLEGASEMDSSAWQHTYESLSRIIASGPGSIHFRHKASEHFETIADSNEPGFVDRFNSEYWQLMPYRDQLSGLASGEHFMRSRDFSEEDFVGSELYKDHFEKLGIYEVLHYCLFDDERVAAGVTFTRDRSSGPFSAEESEFLSQVIPHIERAARLHLRIHETQLGVKPVVDAWDCIDDAVFVVSSDGRVVFRNAAADQVLGKKGMIRIERNGTLGARKKLVAETLQALVRSAFVNSPGHRVQHGGTMRLSISAESSPVKLTVTPFKESGSPNPNQYALVCINLSKNGPALAEAELRQLYGVTRAEARLAMLLAEGHDLALAGDMLEITQNTARTHLKRIFCKTSTNRQSSLVKLILSGSAKSVSGGLALTIPAASIVGLVA